MMKYSSILVFLFATFTTFDQPFVEAFFDPVSLGSIAGIGYGAYYAKNEFCHGITYGTNEWIDKASKMVGGIKWINYEPNFQQLKQKVFGQHIAVELAIKSVQQHLLNDQPERALVLSFHGDTGIGKTFLAKQLAKAIYPNYNQTGSSKFVHTFVSTHYTTDSLFRTQYKLIKAIEDGLTQCERSLFILEEVDKYEEKLLNVLTPFIEHNVKIGNTDYNPRKAIFILLSNTGGKEINSMVQKFRNDGLFRHQIKYSHFDGLIKSRKLSAEGGLKDSDLVTRSMVSWYVPFLPLEREHVKMCIVQYLRDHRGYANPERDPGLAFIENAAAQLTFLPEDTEMYSHFGCRRVDSIVNTLL